MLDLIVSWLCSAIAEAFQAFASFFSNIFGYDISEFNATFPFAATAYDLIRDIGLALAFVIAIWQVITFFWRGADKAIDTPVRAAINTVVAVGFIYYGNYILEAILKFCQYPYDSLLSMDGVEWGFNFDFGNIIGEYFTNTFAEQSMLLYLIMLILIVFSMVKLLLEIIERYVVAFILLYLSPLASATMASSTTSGIYKRFFSMFVSQCVLIFLNAWCLKMACSGLDMSNYPPDRHISLAIPFLVCYAFLRISTKMDSYINQLGLNAAITGAGLGAEIFGAGATILGFGQNGGGSGSGNSGGGSILGAARVVHQWNSRYHAGAAGAQVLYDTVSGGVKGASEGFRSGKGVSERMSNMFKGFGSGAATGAKNSDNLFSNTGRKFRDNVERQIDEHFDPSTSSMPKNKLDKDNSKFDPRTVRLTGANTPEENSANIEAWSNNQNLAQDAFSYVQQAEIQVDAADRVAAIAKGLGVGEQSTEAASFIQAGFGQDGVVAKDYSLDKTGMHAEYDTRDGYRHKMNVYDQAQYDQLTTEQRAAEGLQKFHAKDGRRYYVGTTKTKLEPPPKKEKAENSSQEQKDPAPEP